MTLKTPKGCFRFDEAARRLGLSYKGLYLWVKSGKIKSRKPGKERFIPASEVERIQNGS